MKNRLQTDINISILVKDIVDFHKVSGQHRVNTLWGSFENPFRADYFSTLKIVGSSETIPVLYPDINLVIKTEFIGKDFVDIKSLEFRLAGGIDYTTLSPTQIWEGIFDLSRTHGAIANSGNFFLSKKHLEVSGESSTATFEIFSSPTITSQSQNLIYGLFFAIRVNNQVKYCRLDPMLRTSSEDN